MKTDLAIATTCLLIAFPAMAQSPAPRAQEFVNKVAVSDMFEIQSSQLALTGLHPVPKTASVF
jgi:hypothetical protein